MCSRPPAGQRNFEAGFKLHFDGFMPQYPARAVWSFRPGFGGVVNPRCAARILGNISEELGVARSVADRKSKLRSQLQTVERCSDIFIIQVRGGLSDCAVQDLHIDPKKHEISLDWRLLFREYFKEKHLTRIELQVGAVSDCR